MIPHGLAVVQAQTCRQFNDSKCAQSIIGNVRHRPSRLIAICERAPQLDIGNIGTGNTPTLATLPHSLVGRGLRPRRPVGRAVLGEPPPGPHKSNNLATSSHDHRSHPLRGTSLIAICDVAGRQGKCYRFGGRDFVWGGFEACWRNGAHFRACLGAGGFIPAFARCCFCIAASLLVFTSPMTSPLALLCQYYCISC